MDATDLESKVQYLLDRIEIQDVLARYASAQDDHQANDFEISTDWSRVFTPDAILDYTQAGPPFGIVSYPQLVTIMRGDKENGGVMSQSFQKWQHMLGLPLVDIDGDTAKARSDLLATHQGRTNVGTPWHLFDACIFHDDLIRTEQGWRIQRRRLQVIYVETVQTIAPGISIGSLIGQAA
jgi:SnoaL-like domain